MRAGEKPPMKRKVALVRGANAVSRKKRSRNASRTCGSGKGFG
jgi:hypothetical protein